MTGRALILAAAAVIGRALILATPAAALPHVAPAGAPLAPRQRSTRAS